MSSGSKPSVDTSTPRGSGLRAVAGVAAQHASPPGSEKRHSAFHLRAITIPPLLTWMATRVARSNDRGWLSDSPFGDQGERARATLAEKLRWAGAGGLLAVAIVAVLLLLSRKTGEGEPRPSAAPRTTIVAPAQATLLSAAPAVTLAPAPVQPESTPHSSSVTQRRSRRTAVPPNTAVSKPAAEAPRNALVAPREF